MDVSGNNEEILQLDGGNELRFSVHITGHKVILQVLDGCAELFGAQLHLNEEYTFVYFSSGAVFTESGCTLKIKTSSRRANYEIKTSKEVPVMKDLHEYLEAFRVKADRNAANCPITLITGPTDVGKSTLCRYLLNYAARHGRRPLFIDLDVGQSTLSITGTFGIRPVKVPFDANGRFDEYSSSVYYFGYKSPGHNMPLYKLLLKKLGRTLESRLRREITKSSGVIIDTCGWVNGEGYSLILEIIRSLKVNTVLVIGDNSLHGKLVNNAPRGTEVAHVSELEGVAFRNKTVRCDSRDLCVYEYFYGSSNPFMPFVLQVQFSDLQVFRAKSKDDTHNWRTVDNNLNVTPVPIKRNILHQVLALSYADKIENILLSSVYGFICLIEMDMESQVASVLSPQPGSLPTKYLLMGDITLTPNYMGR